MPTKVFCDNVTGWNNGANITDGVEATYGYIGSSDGTPASDQELVDWNSQVFTDYHFINLHVRYSIILNCTAAGGPDQASGTAHLEYQAGAGWVDIYPSTNIGPTTEDKDQAESEAIIQLPISGDFDLASIDVRGDVASSVSGSGTVDVEIRLHEVFVMVYLDSTFGGFQPV